MDEDFLAAHQIKEWVEMPLWLRQSDAPTRGFMGVDIQRALDAGLAFRPVHDTIVATLDWSRSRPGDYIWRAGLETAKEQAILKAWRNRIMAVTQAGVV